MADLFGDTPPPVEGEDVDPAAEFLAREQDELAAIDGQDDFTFEGATPAEQNDDFGDQGFGDQSEQPPAVQQSYDMLGDDFGGADNFETATEPEQNGMDSGSGGMFSGMSAMRIEPEKIRLWKEEQRMRLEDKDAAEEKEIDERKESAKKEMEDWYKHRDEQLAKAKDANRAAEEAYVKEIEDKEPGSEFERVCRLCDFNPKNSKNTRDVSRLRSILLQLKQSGLQR